MTDTPYVWLSFVNERKPEGSRFVGVVITQAESFGAAVERISVLGIASEATQVAGGVLPWEPGSVSVEKIDTLLDKSTAEALDAEMGGA